MNECDRASALLAAYADGDLDAAAIEWVESHLESCADCRTALAEFRETDSEVTAWAQSLGWQNPSPSDAREQLAAKLSFDFPSRRLARWMPAAAAVILAIGLGAAFIAMHSAPKKNGMPPASAASYAAPAAFVAIPYLPLPDPREQTSIVRVDIPVANLIAAGYRIAADPGMIVPADVLVGEDGRAHAVRIDGPLTLN